MAPHDKDNVAARAREVIEKDALARVHRLAGGFPFDQQEAATSFSQLIGVREDKRPAQAGGSGFQWPVVRKVVEVVRNAPESHGCSRHREAPAEEGGGKVVSLAGR